MMVPLPSAILVLAMTLAQAAPPPLVKEASAKTRAQVLLREGTALFDRGEPADALQKFEEAYRIFPSPKIWFDVGAAQRTLARPVEARESFQRFLDEAPDAPADSRREAQAAVASLAASLGRLTVDCALAGVDVSMDGKPLGVTPLPRAIWATPGRHQLAGRHEGMIPDLRELTVTAGTEQTVSLALRPLAGPPSVTSVPILVPPPVVVTAAPALLAPPPPATSTAERPLTGRWWFWTAAGAVVVAGVVGIVLATRGSATSVPGTTLGSQGFP
jgi:hypothetical protein